MKVAVTWTETREYSATIDLLEHTTDQAEQEDLLLALQEHDDEPWDSVLADAIDEGRFDALDVTDRAIVRWHFVKRKEG